MKKLILILTLVLFGTSSMNINAQDLIQGNPSATVTDVVDKELKSLTQELALTGKQQKLAKIKLTEFKMREKELLNSDMIISEKSEQISALEINKVKEMRDILTGPQYDTYIKWIKEKRKINQKKVQNN
ncbi:hypothetical protein ACFQ3R_05665 [Mesonia ostreae]|uniref:Uncharacterized protein n=1 Tax=Mesonia ostreae TaxID=861110 RepID=A0ABU2KJY1_9FLAO|nr:hypothetical protein [Mesonia ostreae]MDT0294989.1 hypothetical protein [Mesonia ostreae]